MSEHPAGLVGAVMDVIDGRSPYVDGGATLAMARRILDAVRAWDAEQTERDLTAVEDAYAAGLADVWPGETYSNAQGYSCTPPVGIRCPWCPGGPS